MFAFLTRKNNKILLETEKVQKEEEVAKLHLDYGFSGCPVRGHENPVLQGNTHPMEKWSGKWG